MTMRGTPFYFNGDELGMSNIKFDDMNDYRDIATINAYKSSEAKGEDLQAFKDKQKFISRDNTRTPFQWSSALNAGFTTGTPWIKVNPNYSTVNVATEEKDPQSELSYFKKIVALRKSSPVFVYGDYKVFDIENPDVYCYTRTEGKEKVLVLLNFSTKNIPYQLDKSIEASSAKLLLNNYKQVSTLTANKIDLKPWQALIFKLKQP